MIKGIIVTFLMSLSLSLNCQDFSAKTVVENSIAYHDPENLWTKFNGTFIVETATPNTELRRSTIKIDLNNDLFSVAARRDTITTLYTLDRGHCAMAYNGIVLDSIEASNKNMSCQRGKLYKNYYSYLYGLPMKLRDKGAIINNSVTKRTFKGKDYVVVKVNYTEDVGSDVWYFYFDPKSYAMEVYQFYKTDTDGKIKPDSGEYILLSDEAIVNGIKMPKVRKWYYNKDDVYLGTDTLVDN